MNVTQMAKPKLLPQVTVDKRCQLQIKAVIQEGSLISTPFNKYSTKYIYTYNMLTHNIVNNIADCRVLLCINEFFI